MPLVNRTFDQLIDFTRTSAATFVNSSGNIASTPQSRNLLTFTQEFDNAAWVKANATVSANVTAAPDGTQTADKLVETTTTAEFILTRTPTLSPSTTYTFSCYMKAAERSFGVLNIYTGTASCWTWFNLSTGVVSTLGSGATATITAVGNGWYRCTLTIATAATGTPNVAIFPAATNGVTFYAGTAGNGIFIWGAQLEQASSATDYTRNFGGLFPPRFDYDPVTRAPRGLLIEEQRTNLLLRSEEFDAGNWTKSRTTATANATTSPDGTVDADKITETTDAGSHRVFQQAAKAASTLTRTFSVYLKAAERTRARIQMSNNNESVSTSADVNLSAGTITNASNSGSATVVAVGSSITNAGNGWYRCTITATYDATVDNPGAFVFILDNTGAASYTGDGTSGIFIWGAQWEDGAFATSYIPTVASQVTRTADSALIQAPNFASWYNQASGTFVAEFQTVALRAGGTTGHRVAVANDGSNSNVVYLYTYAAIAGGQVVTGGVNQADINGGGSPANNTTIKSAIAYATNDVAVTVNGATPTTDTSVTIPTVNQLGLGSQQSASQLNGWLRSVRYYPTRLTNAQLQALTA